jgi:hypothetical protein
MTSVHEKFGGFGWVWTLGESTKFSQTTALSIISSQSLF